MPVMTFSVAANAQNQQFSTTVTEEANKYLQVGDSPPNSSETVAGSGNTVVSGLNITPAHMKGLIILADKDLTFNTNDDGTPDATLAITANTPLIWYQSSGVPNPWGAGAAVTSVKLINGGTDTAQFCFVVLYN